MLDQKCTQHVGGIQCYGPTTLFTDSLHPVWQLLHWDASVEICGCGLHA